MFADARDRFPHLVAYILCLGAPVGLVFGIWGGLHPTTQQPKFHIGRAIVTGGFAGVVGGAIFSSWVATGDYFPLLAGYGTLSLSRSTLILLHFGVAVLIGISFGFLFQRDVRGYGSCMGWGMCYAIFWWFLAHLTLLPWIARGNLDWSAGHAAAVFGSLVGHILYGLIVGIAYATFDKLWLRLFVESDPAQSSVRRTRHPDAPLSLLGSHRRTHRRHRRLADPLRDRRSSAPDKLSQTHQPSKSCSPTYSSASSSACFTAFSFATNPPASAWASRGGGSSA